jgi:hypothetical protein
MWFLKTQSQPDYIWLQSRTNNRMDEWARACKAYNWMRARGEPGVTASLRHSYWLLMFIVAKSVPVTTVRARSWLKIDKHKWQCNQSFPLTLYLVLRWHITVLIVPCHSSIPPSRFDTRGRSPQRSTLPAIGAARPIAQDVQTNKFRNKHRSIVIYLLFFVVD